MKTKLVNESLNEYLNSSNPKIEEIEEIRSQLASLMEIPYLDDEYKSQRSYGDTELEEKYQKVWDWMMDIYPEAEEMALNKYSITPDEFEDIWGSTIGEDLSNHLVGLQSPIDEKDLQTGIEIDVALDIYQMALDTLSTIF